jgi:DnaJ-related protein SCJ1
MPEGYEVVFEGEADESPDWEPGDVVLRVRSKKEKGGWRRKESSLYWRETIGIDEALLGFERNLTTLDGRTLQLVKEGVTQPGTRCFHYCCSPQASSQFKALYKY